MNIIRTVEHSALAMCMKLEKDLKFMFSKKATKIDEIFTIDLTLST